MDRSQVNLWCGLACTMAAFPHAEVANALGLDGMLQSPGSVFPLTGQPIIRVTLCLTPLSQARRNSRPHIPRLKYLRKPADHLSQKLPFRLAPNFRRATFPVASRFESET
jgi:hypothetical protein